MDSVLHQSGAFRQDKHGNSQFSYVNLENVILMKKDCCVSFSCGSISRKHFNSTTLNIINDSNEMLQQTKSSS